MLLPGAFAASGLSLSQPLAEDIGDNIIVRVYVNDITDFDTAAFTINFKPSALELLGATFGDFAEGASVVVNQANGKVVINAPGFSGLTGSGILAKLSFDPIKAGNIQLTDILLGDNRGMKIDDVPETTNIVSYNPASELLLDSEFVEEIPDPAPDVPPPVVIDDSDDDVVVDDSDDDEDPTDRVDEEPDIVPAPYVPDPAPSP
ncbi:MAG: cohesin domain-containing protein, partial [Anaerolineales bacterium]|nr:cohesin domain-containing protein [Anaerolineales bacterium]